MIDCDDPMDSDDWSIDDGLEDLYDWSRFTDSDLEAREADFIADAIRARRDSESARAAGYIADAEACLRDAVACDGVVAEIREVQVARGARPPNEGMPRTITDALFD